jgi:hypothetical protein
MTLRHRRTLKSLRLETNSLRDGIQWLRHESIQAVCSPSLDKDLDRLDLYAHCLSKVTYEDFEDDYDGSDTTDISQNVEPLKKQKYHHLIYKAYYEELDTGIASKRNSPPLGLTDRS